MILLDTHIWIWWVNGSAELNKNQTKWLKENEEHGLGVSIISCWEVAKLVEYKRLLLLCSIAEWFDQALRYPGIVLLGLTPRIVIESTELPGDFHKDPADQMIVATARVTDCPLLTNDHKILAYPHVVTDIPSNE